MTISSRFKNKVAIVTGAARGIGLAISQRLVAEGCIVILSDIDEDEATVAAGSLGDHAFCLTVDISVPDQCTALVDEVKSRFGRLDVLVNNGSILDISTWDQMDYDVYCRVIKVNQDGVLLMSMAATPLIEATGGGVILNIASIMGMRGSQESIPYSTAKGAVINLTRCMACDLASKNIRVNAISPGFINTRMARLPDGTHEYDTEYFKDVYLKHGKIPLGHTGKPENIAGPAAFLCSEDANYITGHVLVVDGGVTATF